jgi:peptidoglycan/LPS O-acetylase OafA/YrhL
MGHRRIYYGTDTRVDSILFGCLLALAFSPFKQRRNVKVDARFWLSVGVGGLLILFSLLYRDESFRETFRYTLQGIGLMPFFYYAVVLNEFKLFKWLNFNIVKKLGVYSYSIYLIHFVLTGVVEKYSLTNNHFIHFVYVFTASLIFAYFIEKYIDSKFIKLRKKLRS